MTKSKFVRTFLVLGGLFGAMGLSALADASATPKTACAVNQITYDGGRLAIRCVGGSTLYYAIASGSCNAQTIDTLKAWQSLAQVSLVSGHAIDLMYEPAAGSCPNTLYSMAMY